MLDLALEHAILTRLENTLGQEGVVRDDQRSSSIAVVVLDADLSAVLLAPVKLLDFASLAAPVLIAMASEGRISGFTATVVVAVVGAASAVGGNLAISAGVVLVARADIRLSAFTVAEAVEGATGLAAVLSLIAIVTDTEEVILGVKVVLASLKAGTTARAAIGAVLVLASTLRAEAKLALATNVSALAVAKAVAVGAAEEDVALVTDDTRVAQANTIDANALTTTAGAEFLSAAKATPSFSAVADLVDTFTAAIGLVAAKSATALTSGVVAQISGAG